MGIEPTRPAWKAGILAIELHPHKSTKDIIPQQSVLVKYFLYCKVSYSLNYYVIFKLDVSAVVDFL